jgi:hypothetical protein
MREECEEGASKLAEAIFEGFPSFSPFESTLPALRC